MVRWGGKTQQVGKSGHGGFFVSKRSKLANYELFRLALKADIIIYCITSEFKCPRDCGIGFGDRSTSDARIHPADCFPSVRGGLREMTSCNQLTHTVTTKISKKGNPFLGQQVALNEA